MKNRSFSFSVSILLAMVSIASLCFILKSSLPAAAGELQPNAPLPDLDVTFIERQPMYSAYCVEYHWGEVPGMPGKPYLCPGTENERRWPEFGEVVTFTAHIVNKGDLASPASTYNWLIDGTVVETNTLPSIAAGDAITKTYQWEWPYSVNIDGRLKGLTHTVGFSADPAATVAESFESNNTLVDSADALSFQIVITPQMLLAYNEPITTTLPRSAEDWFQKQVKAMNNALNTAVYPATPAGAVTQVHINRFVVRDTPIEGDRSNDGGWFVDADYRKVSAYYDPVTDIDWAWIHEMSHQIGLIDQYMSNVESPFNHVLNREGLRMNIGFHWPVINSIMFGGDTSPYTASWVYDSHSARGLKSNDGYRRGFYGDYLFDMPANNSLLIQDYAGQPVADAQVSLYRKLNLPSVPADVDNISEISGTSDLNGLLSLPNLPVNGGGMTTPTGHMLHDNPFGNIDIVGEQNRYLVKISKGEHEEFQWLDITPFNLAYWQGHPVDYTHTLQTHLPEAGAPPAPILAGKVQGDFLTIYWGEYSDPNILYNVYWMGVPDFRYVKVSDLQLFPWYSASFGDSGFYVVTTVISGKESAFSNPAWLPRLYSPENLVVTPGGDVLVQDSQNSDNFPVISPSGRWLYTQPVTEFSAYGTRYFTSNPDGWLLISQSYSAPDDPMSIHLYNPENEAGFEIGSYGTGKVDIPAGVAWWGTQSYSVAGTYTLDPETLLLSHFDGSFSGAQGEAGTSSGVTFNAGKYGQGGFFDGDDALTYPTAGNLNQSQGSVEFWTKPGWNGNDNQGHTFFEAGTTWENRLKVTKDGANNLRLMTWDATGKEYGVYCPVGKWLANDWYHVTAAWNEAWLMLAVDGAPCQSEVNGGVPGSLADTMTIGNSSFGNEPAGAVIDELRISSLPRFGNTRALRILAGDTGPSQHRLLALDGLGNLVSFFGSPGSGEGQFVDPRGLVIDSAWNVIVVDSGNNRLQVLGFDGAQFIHLRTLTAGFNAPTGVAAYQGWLVVADTGNNQVKVLDPSGSLVATYAAPDSQMLIAAPFFEPHGVAVDRRGEIIVADTGNSRVVRVANNILPKNRVYLPFVKK